MKRYLLCVVPLLVALSACASLPVKEKAVLSLQANQTSLAAVQDAERQICDPTKAAVVPAVPITTCPSTVPGTGNGTNKPVDSLAKSVGLTDERHKAFASALSKAFDLQIKAAAALRAWRAGDPPPDSLTALQTDLTDVLALVKQLAPATEAQVQGLLGKVQAALQQVTETLTILQGAH